MSVTAAQTLTAENGLLRRLARRPLATLFLLCFVAWLPGFFSMPPLDRDESRFAQASKQMIQTGNYVDIRYSVGARYKKPVGIYWMQAASTLAFGKPPFDAIWTYRVPSLLGAFAAVFLAYWCMRAFAPPETALVGAALIGLTVALRAEALIAKTDAVLLATVLGAQGFLMRAYLAARLKQPPPTFWLAMGGWFAVALGIMIKGPIILGVLAVGAAAISLWDRDWKWLKPLHWLPGIALTLLVCLPWGIAIAFASHGQFYEQSLGHDFAAKIMGGQETHGAPPGYYLALSTITLWPVTLFAVPGIGSAIANRSRPEARYLLAWAGAVWVLFEAVPTKLPHYVLPAYPAIAFLGALWAMRPVSADEPLWMKILRIAAGLQFAVALLVFAAAPIVLPMKFGDGTTWWLVAGAAAGLLAGLGALVFFARRDRARAAVFAAIAAIVFYPTIILAALTHMSDIWLTPKAAAVVAKHERPGDPPVVLTGYVEPSLVFTLGTDTVLDRPEDSADIVAERGGLALVQDDSNARFLDRLSQRHATAKKVDTIMGYNYSEGLWIHIAVYRITPAPK